MEEIEIKFSVRDLKAMTAKLLERGFRIARERHFEQNYLFDDNSGNLRSGDRVLRVRKTPSRQTVTYKGPAVETSKVKRREEIECSIEDAEVMMRILEHIGFKVGAEYSKYRTIFEKEGFNVSLDETEAGNYLEIEAHSEQEIIDLGKELGYSEADFIRRTYSELICGERGQPSAKDKEQ